MKKTSNLLALLLLPALCGFGQTKQNAPTLKQDYIRNQGYLSPSGTSLNNTFGDSLRGFDEAGITKQLLSNGLGGSELVGHVASLKRRYIDEKYALKTIVPDNSLPGGGGLMQNGAKKKGGGGTVNVAPCVNEGFEQTAPGSYNTATAVTGWTVASRTADGVCSPTTGWQTGSSEFAIVATPLTNWPYTGSPLGIIPHSPFGGTVVAQLNDAVNDNNTTRIRQTFPVMQANALFQFAYAGYWQDGGQTSHNCCQQPGLDLKMYDCTGAPLACVSMSIIPWCTSTGITFSTNGTDQWSNWQSKSIDLTPYIGSCITVEFTTTDCAFGGHWGTTLLDVRCGGQIIGGTLTPVPGPNPPIPGPVSYCAGSGQAHLVAPTGYASYQWIGPNYVPIPAPQGTNAALTVTNPTFGSTYTCVLISATSCTYIAPLTIGYSTVSIAGIGVSPSCPNGASGSATVMGNGSGSGYTYTWVNTSNNVVGTQSVATSLPPGVYSVTIAGLGSSGCGTAATQVTITAEPTSTQSIIKPFCGSEAYLQIPGGTNIQWYQNTSAISGSAGIIPNYTVAQATNGSVYWVSYTSLQGCRDSVRFTLASMSPGLMTVPPNGIKLICPAASNGTAAINLSPTQGVPPGSAYNTYQVTSLNTTPPYTVTAGPTAATNFTMSGLSPGSYSVHVFDGACKYNSTFNVVPLVFNFTPTPLQSTLCPGNSSPAGVNFTNNPSSGQYTYSWSPTNWLVGNNGSFQNTIITPTGIANGAIVTTVYTIVVTPTAAFCPITKTIAITAVNPPTPTITPIQPLCNSFLPMQISATPGGGTYTPANPNVITPVGLLTPSIAPIGQSSFTYAINVHTCSAFAVGNFHVSQFFTAALTSTVAPLCVTGNPVNLMNIVQQTNGVWQGPGVQSNQFSPVSFNTAPSTVVTLTYNTVSNPNPTVCPDASTRTISVTNTLVPAITPLLPLCSSDAPVTMTVSPSGGGWAGSNISLGGVFIPANVQQGGQQTVTYTVNVGPCLNTASSTFIVGKVSSAGIVGNLPDLCITSAPVNLLSFVQSTVNGEWSALSPIMNVQNNSFSPSSPSPLVSGIYQLQYSTKSIPEIARCAQSKTANISVLNPVMPNISPAGPFCNKSDAVQLTVNSGSGHWTTSSYLDAKGVFTPSLAAVGNNPIQYVVGTPTCFVQQTKFVSVEAFVPAKVSVEKLPDLCNTGAPINLMPYVYNNNGAWAGTGIAGTNFDPAKAGKGQFVLTYTTASSPSSLCPDASTVAVSVFSVQTPKITKAGPFCTQAEPIQIKADVQGGLFGGANTAAVDKQGLFIPASAVIGDNIINYSITSGPCVAYAQTTISVEKFISADFHTLPPAYCQGDNAVNMDHFVVNTGGLWSGDGISGNMFNPAHAKPGNSNLVTYQTHSMPTATLCPDKQTVRIKVVKLPVLNLVASNYEGCAPAEFWFNTPSVNEGNALWTISDGSSKKEGFTVDHIFTTPGVYTVQMNYNLEGCRSMAEFPRSFTVHAAPRAALEVPSEVLVSAGSIQVVNGTTPRDENTYTWLFNGVEMPEHNGKVNPQFTVPEPGRHQITMVARNQRGCRDEVTRTIDVKNDFNVYIPTSFSPNFDGLNDKFRPEFSPYGLDTKSYVMEVFDRWGHSIFHTTDHTKGWDGSVGNKGEPLKEGIYVYTLRFKDLDGNVYDKTGHVSIVR